MQVVKRPIMVLIAVVGMLVAAFGFSAAASAYPPGTAPVLTVSTTTPAPGSSFSLCGSNFTPNEAISIIDNGSKIGSSTASASGSFCTTITVSSVTGKRTIVASGAAGDSASVTVTVTGTGSSTTTGSGGGDLSSTGVATMTIGGLGLLLLLGGGLMLLAGRRRKAVVSS